jgi:hypothetical protein
LSFSTNAGNVHRKLPIFFAIDAGNGCPILRGSGASSDRRLFANPFQVLEDKLREERRKRMAAVSDETMDDLDDPDQQDGTSTDVETVSGVAEAA